jgi:predicted naringenin-chalcone synthase
MHVPILAVGTATPPHRMDQQQALALTQRMCCTDQRQLRLAGALYRNSGVHTRYTAVPHTEAYQWMPPLAQAGNGATNSGPSTEERMAYYARHAPQLARQSSQIALDEAQLAPRDVTHLVTASCTGFGAPGVDICLMEELPLRPTTQRIHVGFMGCHAAINALRVAHGLAHADPRARILVCAVELCSLHFTFHWDSERMLGNALFADGAGAVIVGPAQGEAGGQPSWRIAATGSCLFPETAGAMTWSVGNHGFAMTISSELPRLIEGHLGRWMTRWLAEHGLEASAVRSWAIHPGGPRILDAAQSALELDADATRVSRQILGQYGNMSSATVLFVLQALRQAGATPPCVLLGFGPGVVAEAALLV